MNYIALRFGEFQTQFLEIKLSSAKSEKIIDYVKTHFENVNNDVVNNRYRNSLIRIAYYTDEVGPNFHIA